MLKTEILFQRLKSPGKDFQHTRKTSCTNAGDGSQGGVCAWGMGRKF